MDKLKSTYRELLVAAYRETGEYKTPELSAMSNRQLVARVLLTWRLLSLLTICLACIGLFLS